MLTFAIPFYRGQAYLAQAIASVLAQRNPAFRILVCDDHGPEPGTQSLVQSFQDPRISYHRNEANLGMADNWNRCLDLASTDLVCLLHADDQVLPNYTDLMLRAASQDSVSVLFFCRARIIDSRGNSCFSLADFVKRFFWPTRSGPLMLEGLPGLAAILRANFIMCPTVCYRKSALGTRRFSPHWKFVLDLELFTRLLLEGNRLTGLPETAYAYRRHDANATTLYTRSMLRFQEEKRLYEIIGKTAHKKNWKTVHRLCRQKRIIRFNLLFHALMHLLHFQPKKSWENLVFLMNLDSVQIESLQKPENPLKLP